MILFRDGHLGEMAAALVDGELGHDARDRALAHLTGCVACRAEVDRQRHLKTLLSDLGDPGLTTDITDRLLLLPQTPPRRSRPLSAHSPDLHRARRAASAPPPHRRRLGVAVAGGASAVIATLGVTASFVGGSANGSVVVPRLVSHPDPHRVDQHTATTTEVPFSGAGMGGAVTVSYAGTPAP